LALRRHPVVMAVPAPQPVRADHVDERLDGEKGHQQRDEAVRLLALAVRRGCAGAPGGVVRVLPRHGEHGLFEVGPLPRLFPRAGVGGRDGGGRRGGRHPGRFPGDRCRRRRGGASGRCRERGPRTLPASMRSVHEGFLRHYRLGLPPPPRMSAAAPLRHPRGDLEAARRRETGMSELTPMMRQYRALKDQHPTAILLFRLGDFFEAFFEDAHLVARELQLTLTSRPVAKGRRIPMCGIPHHALHSYLRRLIDRGHRVAICDQVEDPKQTRTLVRREVVRVVTPGTVIEDDLLSARENNFLAAVASGSNGWGLALADLSTGEFYATEGETPAHLSETLASFRPREMLVPDDSEAATFVMEDVPATAYDANRFDPAAAGRILREHLGVATLDAFGLSSAPLATGAAGALVQYLRETQKGPLPHLRSVRMLPRTATMILDDPTQRALALWAQPRDARAQDTLLGVLDLTETPMGGRLLRRWMRQPLLDREEIRARAAALAVPPDLIEVLRRGLVDSPPLSPKDGGLIRPGFDPEADRLRAGSQAAREWMAGLEAAERARTGIRSLKVGYNQVMGYYIEVSKANEHLVPREYIRKGTLVGAERYITAEMKDREALILTAEERIAAREYDVFCGLRDAVRAQIAPLQAAAGAVAEVDVYAALAEAAVRHRYVRPRLVDERVFRIVGGRHPVVEQAIGVDRFVPNDLSLDPGGPDILIVTGPNF